MVDMSQAAPGVPSLARLIRIGGAWRPWPGSTGTTHSYIQVLLMVLMYRNDVNAKQWCNFLRLHYFFTRSYQQVLYTSAILRYVRVLFQGSRFWRQRHQ